MRQYSKLTRTTFIGTAVFLFLLFWVLQAVATDNDTIRQHIENKTTEHANLRDARVTISVEDSFVLLTGSVRFYLQKMNFERIAWKTTGVTEVENEIEVKPKSPLNDTAIESKVQTILMDFKHFHGATYIVHVGKGIVSVTGVFHHPSDVRFLKRQIARIEGVIAINIHTTALIAQRP